MECPSCGREMRSGWLWLSGPDLFTKLKWSPERVTWGPRRLPRDTHDVIGFGRGVRSREALHCEHCATVVVAPEW